MKNALLSLAVFKIVFRQETPAALFCDHPYAHKLKIQSLGVLLGNLACFMLFLIKHHRPLKFIDNQSIQFHFHGASAITIWLQAT